MILLPVKSPPPLLVISETRVRVNQNKKRKPRFLVVLSIEKSDADTFKMSIQYESEYWINLQRHLGENK